MHCRQCSGWGDGGRYLFIIWKLVQIWGRIETFVMFTQQLCRVCLVLCWKIPILRKFCVILILLVSSVSPPTHLHHQFWQYFNMLLMSKWVWWKTIIQKKLNYGLKGTIPPQVICIVLSVLKSWLDESMSTDVPCCLCGLMSPSITPISNILTLDLTPWTKQFLPSSCHDCCCWTPNKPSYAPTHVINHFQANTSAQ